MERYLLNHAEKRHALLGGLVNVRRITCTGCGVKIQTEEPDKLGFAPKSALDKNVVDAVNDVFV